MKKIVLALVALMFVAAPAWADVVITCEQVDESNEVLVSFNATGEEPSLVRAFGLNIQLDNDANILEVDDTINAGYYIFPGTIQIDASTGEVTSYGTAVGEVSDSPDTLPGIGSNGITVEMASLYAPPGGIGSPNSPDSSGPLFSFFVSKSCTVTITANVARAGSQGVVMEDPDQAVVVNLPSTCVVDIGVGPVCWTYVGQPCGDSDDSGSVNFGDLIKLKASWMKSDPDPAYNPCADFTQDGGVNFGDLIVLKKYWMKDVPTCP